VALVVAGDSPEPRAEIATPPATAVGPRGYGTRVRAVQSDRAEAFARTRLAVCPPGWALEAVSELRLGR